MMPSIHDGHMVTAKLPFLKPASQSFDQVGTLALTPSETIFIEVSQACRTTGFESAISLLSLS